MEAFQTFMATSVFLWPILLCSMVALAVVLHRAFSLEQRVVMPPPLVRALERDPESSQSQTLIAENDSPLGRIARAAVVVPHDDRTAAMQATESTAREEVIRLQAGLPLLEVIITVAPLLGLLGTVSGLVTVFTGLGDGGQPSSLGVARGISEALTTTIAGLAVAVPTVVAHSYFQRKVERLAARMEVIMQRVLERQSYRTFDPETLAPSAR